MKYILGFKKEMTQKFAEDGNLVPVTIIEIPKCVVTQLKGEKDGYYAVQLACGTKKHVKKPQLGHFKELGNFEYVREFVLPKEETEKLQVGNEISVEQFLAGEKVTVIGTSKGKGFQGVVRRHHFHGSPKTHGHKDQLRKSGSIGAGGKQNVEKGKRMAGRMGGAQVTMKNLLVHAVDAKAAQMFVRGAVPGPRGSLIMIKA